MFIGIFEPNMVQVIVVKQITTYFLLISGYYEHDWVKKGEVGWTCNG